MTLEEEEEEEEKEGERRRRRRRKRRRRRRSPKTSQEPPMDPLESHQAAPRLPKTDPRGFKSAKRSKLVQA